MRAVVVGGGVAGAASAIALRRIGAEVTVYEAYEDPTGPVGSFLSLAANGLRALDVLGCLGDVQRAGFAVERQRLWSGGGTLLGDVPRHRRAGDALLSVTLMRGDLVRVLRSGSHRHGVRIITGQRVDAGEIAELGSDADLIVGADGIWSATRRFLDPAAPSPRYAGLYTVSGLTEPGVVVPGISGGPDLRPGVFNMIFARAGVFIYLPAPDGAVWWAAQVAEPRQPDLAAIGLDHVRTLFGAEQQAGPILRAAGSPVTRTLNHVLDPVRRRQDGAAVVIGDAAHPVGAGQGASMALEEAVVLARELHRAGDVAAGLASFDALRVQRVGKMARAATANREAKTAGPVAARLRNLIMPLVFPRVYPRATGWLYDYDPGTLPGQPSQPQPAGQPAPAGVAPGAGTPIGLG